MLFPKTCSLNLRIFPLVLALGTRCSGKFRFQYPDVSLSPEVPDLIIIHPRINVLAALPPRTRNDILTTLIGNTTNQSAFQLHCLSP
ncbi:uncharacterized protein GGS22DRAFT_156786 [Annulohypoxylon maeteangense]|uniref:uncharacterized protein n=1 Tax=Annulohypoxylon maeteangense TaxID=1927788 RepID=UPI0020083F31|nr:uncharacterized protein GGS22DRAFT_156786 [Annulohypoxylon maeteangense]KAI0887331.1 hypothetical protein GGS22DRAFT_156786 [Annulohypoxylon maeteangense]